MIKRTQQSSFPLLSQSRYLLYIHSYHAIPFLCEKDSKLIRNSKPNKSIMEWGKKETEQNIVYINIIDYIAPYVFPCKLYPFPPYL